MDLTDLDWNFCRAKSSYFALIESDLHLNRLLIQGCKNFASTDLKTNRFVYNRYFIMILYIYDTIEIDINHVLPGSEVVMTNGVVKENLVVFASTYSSKLMLNITRPNTKLKFFMVIKSFFLFYLIFLFMKFRSLFIVERFEDRMSNDIFLLYFRFAWLTNPN